MLADCVINDGLQASNSLSAAQERRIGGIVVVLWLLVRKAACSVDFGRSDVRLLIRLLAILVIIHVLIGLPLSGHVDHWRLASAAIYIQHMIKLIGLLCLLRDAKWHIRRLLVM